MVPDFFNGLLVAEQFSLADVCYAPFLEFLPLMEIAPSTAIAAWSERVLARPSVVATRPAEAAVSSRRN